MVRIALKEVRESKYWLRVIEAIEENSKKELEFLITESKEIKLDTINKLNPNFILSLFTLTLQKNRNHNIK